jgi:restriction endonuclease S subunit
LSDDWQQTTLADLLTSIDVRAGNGGSSLPVLSVTENRGIITQDQVFRKRVATDDISNYKVLAPYDVAFNPYLLWTGAIGQWLGQRPGATSPVYECFRVARPNVPRFAGLVLESGILTPYFDSTAIGSIQRRRRTTVPVFLAASILLPPPSVQQRIVDLVTTIDAVVAALQEVVTTSARFAITTLSQIYDSFDADQIATEQLATHIIGGSWGSAPDAEAASVIALGTEAFADGRTEVDPRTGTHRSLSAKRAAARCCRSGDIILERSGGSKDQPVGRVLRALKDYDNVVPSDFMRLIRIDPEQAMPDYVFWVLWLRYHRGDTLRFQARSTNIRNLRIPEYLASVIRRPSREEQRRFSELAEAFRGYVAAADAECEASRTVRSALLIDLLTGEHEIPESYDDLLSA